MNNNSNLEIKRYNPSLSFGLSDEQIEERINSNLINYDSSISTKSIGKILRDNFFTLFNLINIILALAIVYVESYKNLLFLGVVISNTIIGTFQEIKAKKTVDKLSIIASNTVYALRNGNKIKIRVNDIVLDDIIFLSQGNQVVTDCIIKDGYCSVNEALLTGESDPINKTVGDTLLSGSFIISGNCKAKVEHISKDNYSSIISRDAKYIKKPSSEIMFTLNKIIKLISILIVPIGTLLFLNQLTIDGNNYKNAIVNTVAALVGMIPEGLVLLTSTVLAVSVIRLSKKRVLVQELYCIETLAKVDTLCLDKTGTITEGCMEVEDTIIEDGFLEEDVQNALCALSLNLQDNNSTINAIKDKYNCVSSWKADKIIPFSSERKWSGICFYDKGSYILGAPEFILKEKVEDYKELINKYAEDYRVILLAKTKEPIDNFNVDNLQVMAFVLIKDKIRNQVIDTLKYFEDQDVTLKIISGDNVKTVASIAKRVGLKNADEYIDMSNIETPEEIYEAAKKYTVFGRVSPNQKKEIIKALKSDNHIVAMTGDGVNDVLSLKEADCSIAMSSGSDAARNVAQLVLLDSNFDSMPSIVAEGRRSINNIQRSASLFLVKTIYSTLLAIIFLFISFNYPFMPIQMTLTSVLTIGIPSFILALEPNKEKITGHFFTNVITKAIPGALTIIINIMLVILLSMIFDLGTSSTSTISVILTGYTGLLLLYRVCTPFTLTRKILFISMTCLFIVGITLFRNLFSLVFLTIKELIILGLLLIVAYFIFKFILALTLKISNKFIKI